MGVNSCLPHVGPRGYTYAPPCLVYLLVSGMLDIKPRVLCLLGKQSPTETYPCPLSFVSLYFEAGACQISQAFIDLGASVSYGVEPA